MLSDPSGMIRWEGCRWMAQYNTILQNNYIMPVKESDTILPENPKYEERCEFNSYRAADRSHAGIGFHSKDNSSKEVFAIAPGVVMSYISDFYDGFSALLVQNDDGTVVVYGEISTNLRKGAIIDSGTCLGKIKRTKAGMMLHIEMYRGNSNSYFIPVEKANYGSFKRNNKYLRSDDTIIDPTFLYYLK